PALLRLSCRDLDGARRAVHAGGAPRAVGGTFGAVVRSHARSFAERARGLRAVSASPATTGFFVRISTTGATRSPACSARRAGSDVVQARSRKRVLTRRSSSE